jgi:hypothetical protein
LGGREKKKDDELFLSSDKNKTMDFIWEKKGVTITTTFTAQKNIYKGSDDGENKMKVAGSL